MKTYFSILQASFRPIANERLSLGLFMFNSNQTIFHYSTEKLNLCGKLLSKESFALLKGYVEGLNHELNNISDKSLNTVTSEYFSYLSKYNNNQILFTTPATIDVSLNQSNFIKLFEKFVFIYEEKVAVETTKKHISAIVKSQLYSKIKSHVNLNKTLTSSEIPTLIIPVKVDFIGKNDLPVAGDFLNFESGTNSLSNAISHFISLIKAFELEKEVGKYFIIGDEPAKANFPEQHHIWRNLRESKLADMIPYDETEKISSYIQKHKVQPFFTEE